MARNALLSVCLLSLVPAAAWSQRSAPARTEEPGTYLGVLFKAVPEARYDELPSLPRGQGVLITHILPDSPAVGDLQRDDILVQYDTHRIQDCEQLVRLIREDRPGKRVRLTYLRSGKEMTFNVTLTKGPSLQLAMPSAAAVREPDVAKSGVKQNGPPAVSVSAVPQADGGLKLTIEYYQEDTGRFNKVTCAGSPAEIDRQVQKLPARVQELTRVALKRIGDLDLNRKALPGPSSSSRQ